MYDKNIIINRLRNLIDNTGQSRETIAKNIGCDTSTITKHYNGDRQITLDFVVRYAQYFNVTTDYLLGLSNVGTTDIDLQFICNYLGLSETAIENIKKSVSKAFKSPIIEIKDFICYFYESDYFERYIDLANDYIKAKERLKIESLKVNSDDDNVMIEGISNVYNAEIDRDVALFRIQEFAKEFIKDFILNRGE